MSAALVLLLAAVLVLLIAPLLLGMGSWQAFQPRLALGLWFGAFTLGLTLLLAALGVTIASATLVAQRGPAGLLVSVGAWGAVFVIAGLIALATGLTEPLQDSYRKSLRSITPVAASREDRGDFVLVRFDAPEPVAIACPGPVPEILLSSALENALSRSQLRSVLAHEYAHLRGRHGFLVRIAELNAACLPAALPAGRKFRRATTMLVELIADDVAARQAGAETLALALERLSELTDSPGLEVRAARLRAVSQTPDAVCPLPLPVQI